MKKIVVALVGMAVLLTSCNYQVIDTTYGYDYAYIELPTGEIIEGEVDSWMDYEDGDQLQVVIDGNTYLVHSSDCALVSHG